MCHRIGQATVLVLLTLALLVVTELVARRWIPVGRPDDVLAGRATADAYAGQSWARAYFEEFGRVRETSWRSYVYWRRRQFQGTYINIDERGFRRTWKPPQPQLRESVTKVFVFGGSVVWGEGARDEHTIPSYVAKALFAAGVDTVEVTNFGEAGYVTMQEVILLEEELRRGNVPTLAIFLDGVNDLFVARQRGAAGGTQNEWRREREFNIDVDGRIYREAAATFIQNTALYRAALGFHGPSVMQLDATRTEALADETVNLYLGTIEIARRLGEAYGFRTLFFWQPLVFTKPTLSAWERRIVEHSDLGTFYARSYPVARRALERAPHVHDLSDLFAQDAAPRYIDFCHLGETGNEIVGTRIAADAAPLVIRQ